MWDRLRAKHRDRLKSTQLSRSVNSMPALASTSSSSSMSSLMLDLLSRTSAVTVNTANVASSTDAANAGGRQTPLPTVTVSSSNEVTSASALPPTTHRSATRQQRESILHYMPPLTCREAQSRPLSDSRSVCKTAVVLLSRKFFFCGFILCFTVSMRVLTRVRLTALAYLNTTVNLFCFISQHHLH